MTEPYERVKAAAFFDLDNTLMQGASLYYFARGLAARKYFTTTDLLRFGWSQVKFRLLAAEHAGDIAEARQAALAFIEGWRVEDVSRLSEEIFDELMAERIWAGTRAIAEQHIADGDRVWLVTAAPVELGEVIARRLGLTGALGTVAEIHNGVYTGRLVGEMLHGPAKETAVRALAAAEGFDLADCYAYSDSVNDLPMLSAVGHPTAVNPDGALRRHARARSWQIRDFRTGRKAAKVAVPATLAAGVLAGAVAAGLAIRARRD
ncbi:HAD-IB family hydrolase [Hamadaea sp. NPDC050747]|uniref:HAD family hydrolase n=1 Tax=Hamadaea sp. NPDC050747 TaxID=3155789 RepID=UPI0033E90E68